MVWHKLGLVYVPDGTLWWARSYAHLPTADLVDDNTLRVYSASLDDDKYGRIGYVELDPANPCQVRFVTPEPVLGLGELGSFDDCGVNPCCILDVEGDKYLYYIGWQRCQRTPYMLFTGLAIGDGTNFERVAHVPVLDRTPDEPYLRSSITILHEGGIFRAWYVSGLGWTVVNGTQYPSYVIRYTESPNGIKWKAYNHICLNLQNEDEFGLARPWIMRDGSTYKLWYSIRSRSAPYRIGYAESSDGIHWTRLDDQIDIVRSASGWDSEMICYPCLVKIRDKVYMFYNGNRHGASGFGLAVWEP